jgi:hypothetical protein
MVQLHVHGSQDDERRVGVLLSAQSPHCGNAQKMRESIFYYEPLSKRG